MATLDRTDTASRVLEVVAQKLNRDKNTLQEPQTFQDLGADSLDMVEIIMRLEEVFNIEINDEEAENLVTLKDVIDYVQGSLTKPPRAW
jgi:acyl carrier protein